MIVAKAELNFCASPHLHAAWRTSGDKESLQAIISIGRLSFGDPAQSGSINDVPEPDQAMHSKFEEGVSAACKSKPKKGRSGSNDHAFCGMEGPKIASRPTWIQAQMCIRW